VLYSHLVEANRNLMKRQYPSTSKCLSLSIVLTLCLAGCTSTPPPIQITPTPAPTQTSELSEQINLLATQTQAAVAEAKPSQPAAATPADTPAPVVLPMVSVEETVGPFKQVSKEEAMIAGRVISLQAGAEGSFVLLSESGYSRYQDGVWSGYFTEEVGALVGIDPAGRAWAAARDGSQIAVWEDDAWRSFGSAEGWSPLGEALGNPVEPGITIGPDGNLWLATAYDVRRFDGARWQVFTSETMEMPPAQSLDLIGSFTLALASQSGELWVGRCDWGGPGPFGGGGIRKYDGQSWLEAGSEVNTGCVTTIYEDRAGNVWAGVDSGLYRFTPSSASWEQIPLPAAPAEQRYGFITGLTSGPDGDLWVTLAQCGGASCYVGEDIFHLDGDAWQQVGETSLEGGQQVLFDAGGKPWLFSAGSVYQVVGNGLEPVAGLFVQAAATDASGNLWLVAQSTGTPTLWKLEP